MTFKEKIQAGKFPVDLANGEKIQFEILKKFSGEKRVYLGAELYEIVRQLIKDGIHNLHPDLVEEGIDSKARDILAPWSKKKH